MKKGLTEIVVIADRSGSMSGTIEEARNSINRLIEEQKAVEGEATFTFVMFDDMYEEVRYRDNLNTVKPIGPEYDSRGMTALYDAIGKTINKIGYDLSNEHESDRPEKVIVAIVTDGMENSSKEYTRDKIAEMIKLQQDTYNWEFIFFGADIDSCAVGNSLNISAQNTMDYDNTKWGVNSAYTNLSARMKGMRS